MAWHVGQLAIVSILATVVIIVASVSGPMVCSITSQGDPRMGMAVGGAKDIATFRRNLLAGKHPQPTDFTFEGLFYDYTFPTGTNTRGVSADHLFQPTWSAGRSRNPLSGLDETFLAVGLESNLDQKSFSRPPLNLMIVLDVSGSMAGGFSEYYYDGSSAADPEESSDKLDVACRSINALIDHLRPVDRLGMLIFDSRARLAKPLFPVGATDVPAIKQHILDLLPGSATNMEDGLHKALEQFHLLRPTDRAGRENRVIFLTDAMPNCGMVEDEGLVAMAREAAAEGIHLTFIGVGLDFNTELIEAITKTEGANYFAVHSQAQFKRHLDEEFDLMVFPLLFDLTVRLEGEGVSIARVYGSPEADRATGKLLHVKTLFPSWRTEEGVRGGVILVKLHQTPVTKPISLTVKYPTRDGSTHVEKGEEFVLTVPEEESFDHPGVRKAVLLARYGDLLSEWLHRTRAPYRGRHSWERASRPIEGSPKLADHLQRFLPHFDREAALIGDSSLDRERPILQKLLDLS